MKRTPQEYIELKKEAKKLKLEGYSTRYIAKKLNISRSTSSLWTREVAEVDEVSSFQRGLALAESDERFRMLCLVSSTTMYYHERRYCIYVEDKGGLSSGAVSFAEFICRLLYSLPMDFRWSLCITCDSMERCRDVMSVFVEEYEEGGDSLKGVLKNGFNIEAIVSDCEGCGFIYYFEPDHNLFGLLMGGLSHVYNKYG